MATKNCLQCNKSFIRKKGFNLKWWATAKYCSHKCSTESKIGKPGGMLGKKASNKGKKMSTEQKLKISLAKQGSVPWNKGFGKSRGFDVRRTRKFKEFRINILIKSSYRCSECGVVNGRLEIDHIKPVKFFPELVLDEENVRVLCRECHKKTPTYGIKVFNYEHA